MTNRFRKELIEWTILVVVVLTLYITGWYVEIAGQLQRVIVATGLLTPDTEINSRPADFQMELVNAQGDFTSLQTYRGKTIFINFWASWCPPCIAEMPGIAALHEELGEEVVFLMVSMDQDRQKAVDFMQGRNYNLPSYFPASTISRNYKTNVLPTTYVISPKGEIVLEHQGMAQYDSETFREFLKGQTQ